MFSFAAAIRALCGRCPTLLAPKSARADRRLKRAAGATVEAMEQRLLLSAVPPGVQFSADAVYSDSGNPGAYIFDLSGGTATFDTDISKASPDWQNATIALGDGTKAVFNSPQTLLGLQLAGSAKLTASTGGGGANGNFIDIGLGGLSMSTTATIDLADNDMILQNAGSAGVAQMQSLVSSAFNGGNWLGAGVGSSDAASSVGSSMPMGIGYAENCAPNLATPFTTFDGVVVTSTTVFAKYTLASDANLDGRINNKDYAALERYYNQTGTNFPEGDFNYDGQTNVTDYNILYGEFGDNLYGPNEARVLQPIGQTIAALSSQTYSGPVGSFTDSNNPTADASTTSYYTDSIDWGNNNFVPATLAANGNGGFTVSGTSPFALSDPNALITMDVGYASGSPYAGQLSALSTPITLVSQAITNLMATAASTSEIDLAFSVGVSNATGIQVGRSTDGTNFTTIATLATTATTYADTGLSEGTHYLYQVTALPLTGTGATSSADNWTLPSTPSSFTGTVVGPNEVDLAWQNNTAGASAITIGRSSDGINFEVIATIDPSMTSYADTTAVDGTSYTYQLIDILSSGTQSLPLNLSVPATPLAPPSDVSASLISATEIDVAWQNNSPIASGFKVYRSTDGTSFSLVATLSGTSMSAYADMGIPPGTHYYYQIAAVAAGMVDSVASAAGDAATPPVVSVAASGSVTENQALTLTSTVTRNSSQVDPITGWTIVWGDGITTTPSGDPPSFTHTYTAPGKYTITPTALTAAGPITANTLVVQVGDPVPVFTIDAASPANVDAGQTVTVVGHFNDGGGEPATGYLVDWNDGTEQAYPAGTSSFTHSYSAGDTDYVITAAVQTPDGTFSDSTGVSINPPGPQQSSGSEYGLSTCLASGTPTDGQPVTEQVALFAATCNGHPPSSATYTLNWGDGSAPYTGTASLTQPDLPSHTYDEGHFLVSATTADGAAASNWIDVYAETPTLTLTSPSNQSIAAGQPVTISATYSGLDADAQEVGQAFIDWGDGRGQQPISGSFSSRSGSISATLSNPPEGILNGNIVLYDAHGNAASVGFALSGYAATLVIDSNNDDGTSDPVASDTPAEEAIKDSSNLPGKILMAGTGDTNANGVPDFADGIDAGGTAGTNAAGPFTPIDITLSPGVDPSTATFSLGYAGSDPAAVIRSGSGTDADPYVYTPAAGNLRIWAHDGSASRKAASLAGGGDFITPGVAYPLSSLPAADRINSFTWRLYVEGINPTGTAGSEITLAVNGNDGGYPPTQLTMKDAARVTVSPAVTLRVDGNRDGTITFNNADLTTAKNPYTFWLNDDHEGVYPGTKKFGFGTADVQDSFPVDAMHPADSTDNHIRLTRDLQDFAPVQVQFDPAMTFDQVVLHFTAVAPGTSPAIKLFKAKTADESYLTDSAAATAQVNSTTKEPNGGPLTVSAGQDVTLTAAQFKDYVLQAGDAVFIFEGVTAGAGELQIIFKQGNGKTATAVAQDQTYLNLQPVNSLYEHWTVGETDQQGATPAAVATPASGSGSFPANDPNKDYILYVHGWRLTPFYRDAYGNTSYKRLFWAKYKGRFGMFSWPTEYIDTPNLRLSRHS